MPLIVGIAPDALVPGGSTPTPVAQATTWAWHSADGTVLSLGGGSVPSLQPGAQGLDVPPLQVQDFALPSSPGSLWVAQRWQAREVLLPVVVWGTNDDQWRSSRLDLFDAFTSGEGTLVVAGQDLYRTLGARYVGGLESPRDGEQGALRYSVYGIQLRAYDPFWYGPDRAYSWEQAEGVDFFPGPPWVLSPGNVFGSTTLVNDGAQPVWPEFHLDGPMSSATFIGPAGDTFTYAASVADGETVTIRTDPRLVLSQRVLDSAGASQWANISGDGDPFAVFWPLPAGESTVSVTSADTGANTRITMTYRAAYLTW